MQGNKLDLTSQYSTTNANFLHNLTWSKISIKNVKITGTMVFLDNISIMKNEDDDTHKMKL